MDATRHFSLALHRNDDVLTYSYFEKSLLF